MNKARTITFLMMIGLSLALVGIALAADTKVELKPTPANAPGEEMQGLLEDAVPQSLTGSYVAFDPSVGGDECYLPGETQTFCFKTQTSTLTWEWATSVWEKFPADWTVTDVYTTGTATCTGGGSFGPMSWAFETSPYEVKVNQSRYHAYIDTCTANYCFDVITGSSSPYTQISWYWAGDDMDVGPHHPCSVDNYTPPSMSGHSCDQAVDPRATIPACAAPTSILLVDDDSDALDVRDYYLQALNVLGLSPDIWDTNHSDNEPDAATLSNYDAVIWFSGAAWDEFAGPGEAGSAALVSYLDGGGCMLLTSQDYLWAHSLSELDTNYLGISAYQSDQSQLTVNGSGLAYSGLGPFTLNYPYANFSDVVTPSETAETAFVGNMGGAAIDKFGPSYFTTFMGFPLETISRPSDRAATLSAFLGACATRPHIPAIQVKPLELSVALPPENQLTRHLEVCNVGELPLDWSAYEVLGWNPVNYPPPPATSSAIGRSTAVPAGFTPSLTLSENKGVQAGWAGLFKDANPWGSLAWEDALNAHAIPYEVHTSAEFPTLSFSTFGMIIIACDQPQGFYDAYAAQAAKFENYVQNGGVLLFCTADHGFNVGILSAPLPGGVTIQFMPSDENDIDVRTHPMVAGISSPFAGSSASHSDYSNLPGNAHIITHNSNTGEPTMVEYALGYGNIVAFSQPVEYNLSGGEPGGAIIANSLRYGYNYANYQWLSETPLAGTLPPGDCSTVDVTFDTTGMGMGEYIGYLLVQSTDPVHPFTIRPVILKVQNVFLYLPTVTKN